VTVSIRKPFEGKYVLTQRFGENPDVYAQFGKPGHNGLDYGLPNGTPVLQAADGMVLKTGYEEKGYGHYVIVQHNGFQTLYAHLQVSFCSKGTTVKAGEVIGLSDNTGFSTGSHLHFELRVPGYSGAYNRGEVNPLPFIEDTKEDGDAVARTASSNDATITRGQMVKLCSGNDYVNIRNGAGIQYQVVGKLFPQDTAKLVMDIQDKWAGLLKWSGCELWCHVDYLEIATDDE